MPPARPFSRAVRRATRSALLVLVLLDAAAAAAAAAGVFLVTGNTVRREIERRINDEIAFLEQVLRESGVAALARVVTEPQASDESGSTVSGLFTPEGAWIAGDLRALPPFWDEGRFAYDPPGPRPESTYVARLVRSGDVLIAVGRSDRVLA